MCTPLCIALSAAGQSGKSGRRRRADDKLNVFDLNLLFLASGYYRYIYRPLSYYSVCLDSIGVKNEFTGYHPLRSRSIIINVHTSITSEENYYISTRLFYYISMSRG